MHRNTTPKPYLRSLLASCWLLAGASAGIAQPPVSEPCSSLLAGSTASLATQSALDPGRIQVFNWNIQKSIRVGWQEDLLELAAGADFVLLQEVALEKAPLEALSDHEFGAFAPGYSTDTLTTGVMTLSTVQADSHCALEHQEPWLQTPKATVIGLYPLDGGGDLLVANLHGVNFSLGTEDLALQLSDIAAQIQRHEGPVILAGDFNTWSSPREAELTGISAILGLYSVSFAEDSRVRVFGYPLDHMLVRGLEVLESHTYTVDSSDHNPFTVTLRLSDNSRAENLL